LGHPVVKALILCQQKRDFHRQMWHSADGKRKGSSGIA